MAPRAVAHSGPPGARPVAPRDRLDLTAKPCHDSINRPSTAAVQEEESDASVVSQSLRRGPEPAGRPPFHPCAPRRRPRRPAGVRSAPAAAKTCATDATPGATLLLPYFEVNLDDPNGLTTLFSVNNASATSAIAHLVVWSDLAVPVFAFDTYLTGYDVQTLQPARPARPRLAAADGDRRAGPQRPISPKGLFSQDLNFQSCQGQLPPSPMPAEVLAHVQAALTGRPSPLAGESLLRPQPGRPRRPRLRHRRHRPRVHRAAAGRPRLLRRRHPRRRRHRPERAVGGLVHRQLGARLRAGIGHGGDRGGRRRPGDRDRRPLHLLRALRRLDRRRPSRAAGDELRRPVRRRRPVLGPGRPDHLAGRQGGAGAVPLLGGAGIGAGLVPAGAGRPAELRRAGAPHPARASSPSTHRRRRRSFRPRRRRSGSRSAASPCPLPSPSAGSTSTSILPQAQAGANPAIDPTAAQAWVLTVQSAAGRFATAIDAFRLDSACSASHFGAIISF